MVVGKIQMRRYAYLKEPIKTNKKDYIYKIMLYQTKKDGVYVNHAVSIIGWDDNYSKDNFSRV